MTERAVVMTDIDRYFYDVAVIGAGGSGLRAAIEARLHGKKTAIISKSLFGKAYTVMAEGGCAAAMGNVNPDDLVGIIRREEEIKTALTQLEKLRERAATVSAPGGTVYNPGWHLALATSCSSPSAWRGRRWNARNRGAGTPAMTTR